MSDTLIEESTLYTAQNTASEEDTKPTVEFNYAQQLHVQVPKLELTENYQGKLTYISIPTTKERKSQIVRNQFDTFPPVLPEYHAAAVACYISKYFKDEGQENPGIIVQPAMVGEQPTMPTRFTLSSGGNIIAIVDCVNTQKMGDYRSSFYYLTITSPSSDPGFLHGYFDLLASKTEGNNGEGDLESIVRKIHETREYDIDGARSCIITDEQI